MGNTTPSRRPTSSNYIAFYTKYFNYKYINCLSLRFFGLVKNNQIGVHFLFSSEILHRHIFYLNNTSPKTECQTIIIVKLMKGKKNSNNNNKKQNQYLQATNENEAAASNQELLHVKQQQNREKKKIAFDEDENKTMQLGI